MTFHTEEVSHSNLLYHDGEYVQILEFIHAATTTPAYTENAAIFSLCLQNIEQ